MRSKGLENHSSLIIRSWLHDTMKVPLFEQFLNSQFSTFYEDCVNFEKEELCVDIPLHTPEPVRAPLLGTVKKKNENYFLLLCI